MQVSVDEWLVLAATGLFAGTVQAAVGFGANLLAVPVMALVVPAALPGALLFPTFPLSIAMAVHERGHIDANGNKFLTIGRVPGTLLGAAIVAAVSVDLLGVLAGTAVLAAVLISIAAARLHPGVTPRSAFATGVAAGTLGTTAAIDGPPLALLYQHHEPEEFRATLATQFVIGTLFAIVGLLVADRLHGWQVLLGLSLVPTFGLGMLAGLKVRPYTKGRNLRPLVLSLAGLAGLLAIVRGLT